jgi:hypothetical protein
MDKDRWLNIAWNYKHKGKRVRGAQRRCWEEEFSITHALNYPIYEDKNKS